MLENNGEVVLTHEEAQWDHPALRPAERALSPEQIVRLHRSSATETCLLQVGDIQRNAPPGSLGFGTNSLVVVSLDRSARTLTFRVVQASLLQGTPFTSSGRGDGIPTGWLGRVVPAFTLSSISPGAAPFVSMEQVGDAAQLLSPRALATELEWMMDPTWSRGKRRARAVRAQRPEPYLMLRDELKRERKEMKRSLVDPRREDHLPLHMFNKDHLMGDPLKDVDWVERSHLFHHDLPPPTLM